MYRSTIQRPAQHDLNRVRTVLARVPEGPLQGHPAVPGLPRTGSDVRGLG